MRIGHGFDVHAFGGEGPIIIGGVRIPYEKGLLAHSDGDVALHALLYFKRTKVGDRDSLTILKFSNHSIYHLAHHLLGECLVGTHREEFLHLLAHLLLFRDTLSLIEAFASHL